MLWMRWSSSICPWPQLVPRPKLQGLLAALAVLAVHAVRGLILALVLTLANVSFSNALASTSNHVPGEILLILEQPGSLTPATGGHLITHSPDLADVLDQFGLTRGEYLVRKEGPLSDRDRCFLRLRVEPTDPGDLANPADQADRADPAGLDVVAAARAMAALPGVAAASPNYLRVLFLVPNDTYFATQWHFQPGNPAGVNLSEAWDLEMGHPDVVIAVMDTGVDWGHPDLAANIHLNAGEIPSNGLDDDLNGYIDDVRGWDFGDHDADARPHVTLELGLDVGFHGTHCAGIAAAVTNNGLGVAGAAGGCSLIPLKIVDSASQFTDAAIAEAFLYAIDNGADIVSMSFGGPDGAEFYQHLVDQAIAAGVVCVAAAGNNNDAAFMYPAACSGVISVGATNPGGLRASFSTYGTWVTVNAPGEHIWSSIQTNYDFDLLTGLLYMLAFEWDGINPYMYGDGTSMACPLVAGVCGLIRTRRPDWTPAEVSQHLLATGQDVAYDQPLGIKVDALAALQALEGTPVGQISSGDFLAFGCAPNPCNPSTEVSFHLPGAGIITLEVLDARGQRVRTLMHEYCPAGPQRVIWNGQDYAGQPVASGAYLLRLQTVHRQVVSRVLVVK